MEPEFAPGRPKTEEERHLVATPLIFTVIPALSVKVDRLYSEAQIKNLVP